MGLFNVFSGQGTLYYAERNPTTGLPGPLVDIGEIDEFNVGGEQDSFNIQTNRLGGQRAVIHQTYRAAELTGSLNLRSFSPRNLALGLFGAIVDTTSGTVTNEAFPSGLVVGDEVILARRGKTSALTIVDSTSGTPVTAVEGTHYAHNGYGRITILSMSGLIGPLKATTYTVEAIKTVPILTQQPPVRWLYFEGENTAETNALGFNRRYTLDLRKCQFSLAGEMNFINPDEYGAIPLEFTVLADDKVVGGPTSSKYGQLTYLDIN